MKAREQFTAGQRKQLSAPDAVQVSGYDLLGAVMEIVEEIRGKYE